MTDEAELRMLPPRTRLLARQIGLTALHKLSRAWGGVAIYVPSRSRLTRNHALSKLIGFEAAQALAESEGREVDVPFCMQAVSAALHAEIRHYRQTHTVRETALKFRVTERWVYFLVASADDGADPQEDLFR